MASARLLDICLLLAELCLMSGTLASQCRFPNAWHGMWYQSSLGDVIIHDSVISDKGVCKEKYNDYYIMEKRSEDGSKCRMCMLIIQRHVNIIQYRQSFCLSNIDKADKCRWKLPVENPLHTLVKANGHPVECPFSEAYKFKYKNNTRTFCQRPESHMKPCARSSKFHFRFRRCRNLEGTHDKDLEFQCLATWKDGNDKFLYGGFSGSGIVSSQDIYRCFKYDTTSSTGISIAMSADASCQGLSAPDDGPLVMSLTRDLDSWDLARCQLPDWLRHHQWRDLTGRHLYESDKTGRTWQISFRRHDRGRGHVTSALRCNKIIQGDGGEFVAVAFTSDDCDSFYQCMRIKRIKDDVVEFSQGPPNSYQIDFCDSETGYKEKKILFHVSMRRSDCPFHGRLETSVDMADVTSCTSRVLNGCNGSHVMQIHSECVSEQTHNVKLECLSDWNQEGKHYVIAREIVPHGSLEDENRLANCFAFAYEGANLRIETDSECNQGAEHITGKAIKLLVDGHTNPCQKPEQEEESSPRSSKAPYPYPDSHLAHPVLLCSVISSIWIFWNAKIS